MNNQTSMMVLLPLLLFTHAALATVIVRSTCEGVDSDALAAIELEDMVVAVYLTDEPLMRMEAWTAARLRAGRPQAVRRAVLMVGCQEPSIGLAFQAWTPGMDCGERYLHSIVDNIDALDRDDELTVKLEHLLRHLPTWHDGRQCSIGTEGMRATIFWVIIVAGAFAFQWLAARERSKQH